MVQKAGSLFDVNIASFALERIGADVKRPYERIGVLIGSLLEDGLWINDIVPGGNEETETICILPATKLARIADDIMKGKIRGRIVGWYHSHPGYGIFMSEIDLETQSNLLQFSRFIVALVIDPEMNEFGIWALEPDVGVVQVPNEHIRIV
jgi:proteasome lid subunit RPN8/RPN11